MTRKPRFVFATPLMSSLTKARFHVLQLLAAAECRKPVCVELMKRVATYLQQPQAAARARRRRQHLTP